MARSSLPHARIMATLGPDSAHARLSTRDLLEVDIGHMWYAIHA